MNVLPSRSVQKRKWRYTLKTMAHLIEDTVYIMWLFVHYISLIAEGNWSTQKNVNQTYKWPILPLWYLQAFLITKGFLNTHWNWWKSNSWTSKVIYTGCSKSKYSTNYRHGGYPLPAKIATYIVINFMALTNTSDEYNFGKELDLDTNSNSIHIFFF